MHEPPYAGRVLNVSVMGGFAYADTPFNGLTVVVTALDQAAADALAREIAEAGWARREQFRPSLTSLEDATARAKATEDTTRHPLIFADVADNPGGGGRGNTMCDPRGFPGGGRAERPGRRDPRSRPGRRGARPRTGRAASRRGSTARAATNSASRSPPRRPWSPACATRPCAAGAASTPTTRSTLA